MAICGMCKKHDDRFIKCGAGHECQYPTMVTEHDCQDYEYDCSGERIQATPFNQPEFSYCNDCTHCFSGVCSGKRWIPFICEPRCEFFTPKEQSCKHADPCLQYGNGLRNNRCKLRDVSYCHNGHYQNGKHCYEPAD